ncbi:flagellar hook-length control protein FliK [Bradyrhizobium sediminis]|uniref:flagellar hook-length control protein FliK n=1 Tax=Bradyrhizobium sediminis TaxID=2840469 RepID=UPI00201C654D|nr:flagellar hook-length control protein FliK [Bradyrhizobium sediminis]
MTTDPTASVSFQAPAPRSARSDQSPGNDSFAALVDSNAPPDANDNAHADAQSASQRRSDDAAATAADVRRSRDAAAADRAARNDADDRVANSRRRAGINTDAASRADARPGTSKGEPATRSDAEQASDESAANDSAADAAAPAVQDGAVATTPDPVAVPIAAAATAVPAASPASGNATAPLAIAAAAIAASASDTGASAVASSAQAKIDPDAGAAAAAGTPNAAAAAKADAQTAATAAAAAQPAAETDAIPAAGVALAASVAAPVAPKAATPAKAAATQTPTAASDGSDAVPGTGDPAATAISTATPASHVAQPAPAAGKPKAGHEAIDAAKADGSAGAPSASAANGSGLAPPTAAQAGPTPLDPSGTGVQAANAIQPQLHAGPAAAAAPLTVTAATDAAVPLGGLALEIAVSARSGKSRFEIRLDPADLGRIDVRIDVDRNGLVTSHLMVEKAETLSMLRQDAPQLQRALNDAGLLTGDGGLQFSLRDQSSSGQNNGDGSAPNAHRLVVAEEDSIPAVIAGRTYGRMLGSSSGVDIRV